ncbi:HNH endonuclease [Kineococcus sp. SYSU DK002]|uniref:HNH endonuclease n=1 Tax=Kineococcus sp. SYSU DK002 TaxID=3383123 RepID=UPI003D7E3273
MTRPNGSTRRWRTLRASVLRSNPMCAICYLRPADCVDHIVPLNLGGARYELSNLRPSCTPCNAARGDGTRTRSTTVNEPLRTSEDWLNPLRTSRRW